jgi:cytochrome d ubiquinol oxidase subunit II
MNGFWIDSILLFLGVAILFYVLFAGADFGAGIIELFLGLGRREGREREAEQRKLISHAIAPVWEANHVWLVLAVVILFVGFPRVYTTVSTYLHLPVLAVLVGVVARGCAFTFRHYDAPAGEYYRLYSWVFSLSSLWTSLFLGIVAGAMMAGRIDPGALDFHALYIAPWLNGFCLAMGAFASALFGFLASVYLIGEAGSEESRAAFKRKAVAFAIAGVALGAAVFVSAQAQGIALAARFLDHPLSLASFVGATALWLPFWKSLSGNRSIWLARALGAAIVSLVLLGWFAVRYPVAVSFAADGASAAGITFAEAAAPEATLRALLGALVVGSLAIFPSLAYLFKVFKWRSLDAES